MAKKHKAISIDWNPKDAIDGMMQLDALEELAYRRIIDFIYITEDKLLNDDKQLAWMTKTGRSWKAIKKKLIDLGKIEVVDNYISNAKCRVTLHKIVHRIEQKSIAGNASVEARKQLELHDTGSTAVATERITEPPTEGQREGQPTSNQQVSNYINPPLPPLQSVDNFAPPDADLSNYFMASEAICRALGIRQLDMRDQEILCRWIEQYDIRAFVFPVFLKTLGKFRAKNLNQIPDSLAYFDAVLSVEAHKTTRQPIRGLLRKIGKGAA